MKQGTQTIVRLGVASVFALTGPMSQATTAGKDMGAAGIARWADMARA